MTEPTEPTEPTGPVHPLRLAEAAAVLSLATDLSMGQPLEHGLRCALVSVRIARALGLAGDDLTTVYYTGVLHFAGCTAESEIDAGFFGDESAARPQMLGAQFGSRGELIAMAMRTAHQGKPAHVRAAKMARSAVGGIAEFKKWARSHCDVARLLGARMGFSDPIQLSLRHLYERWDGKGMPGDLRGEQIPQPVRIMQAAQDADIAYQRGGPALARTILSGRACSASTRRPSPPAWTPATPCSPAWTSRRSGTRRWPRNPARSRPSPRSASTTAFPRWPTSRT